MTELALALVVVLFVVREVFNFRERRQLLNRLMARDYAQYRYYEDKWKADLGVIKKVQEADLASTESPDADAETVADEKKLKEVMSLKNFEEFAAEEDDG